MQIPEKSQTPKGSPRPNTLTLARRPNTRDMLKYEVDLKLSFLNTKDIRRMNNNQMMNILLMGGAIQPPCIP
jgi:hypothetical protein